MMYRKNSRIRRTRKGFTLLEILLVVGLLALLASFAIPALVNQGESAKKNMARAAIGSNGPISGAIKLYKFNTGAYPEKLMDLIEKPSDDDVAEKWEGPYLDDEEGLKDPWNKDYEYKAEGEKNEGKYDLWSNGPDMKSGTDDDIGNWKDDR